MPPPPFFGPRSLFTPQEMEKNFSLMKKNFDAMQKLRADFAQRLKKGSVSREEVIAHFSDVEKIMEEVKKDMREKTADKISAMTLEERESFAQQLLEKAPPR
jgi:hypothetical protein